MRVTRSYTWPMGHRLLRHQGRCRAVHGHNWVAEVTVRSADDQPAVQGDDSASCGMVLDFADLDRAVAPIIDAWDHGFMVEARDPLALMLRQYFPERLVQVSFTPTSENIAAELFRLAQLELDAYAGALSAVRVTSVRVSESARSWAEWREEDQ